MPRRNNDLADLDFLVRYGSRPFYNPNWAVAFIGIGVALAVCHALFVGTPSEEVTNNPIEVLGRQMQVIFGFRFLVPSALFSVVGWAGLITCLIRDWRDHRGK